MPAPFYPPQHAPLYVPQPAPMPAPLPPPLLPPVPAPLHPPLPASLPAPLSGVNSIPWFLEQVLFLQHQQLQQMQLTEQIRIRVSMWAAHTFHSGIAGVDTLKSLGGHVPQPAPGLFLDPLKQASLPHANPPPHTGSVPQGLVPLAPRPDESRALPTHRAGALMPQAAGPVPFQGPFPAVALDPARNGRDRPSDGSPADVAPRDKAGMYMCRCKYCSKFFATDTLLQAHLRSHAEERAFACSVCGQYFSTEGDLRAHFQQHFPAKANPPHPQPFGGLHGKPAMGVGAPCARSAPVPQEAVSLGKAVLVTETPGVRLPQHPPCGAHPKDPTGGSLAPCPQPWPPEGGEATCRFSVVGSLHNYAKAAGLQGSGPSKPGAEALKSQKPLENKEKAATDPNECHICHRVLSSKRSLKMHYRTHTRESANQCKTCDRIFATKENLNTHLKTHQPKAAPRTKPSCPICQKKFSNAVKLQQHIRLHTSGQIPSTLVLEKPCDLADPEPMKVGEDGSASAMDPTDGGSTDADRAGPQDAPSSSSKIPMPLASTPSASPAPGFTITAVPVGDPAPVGTEPQSSSGRAAVDSGVVTSLSSAAGDPKCQSQSSGFLEAMSFQALTPVSSEAESKSKVPGADGQAESSEHSHTDVEGGSRRPLTIAGAQPAGAGVEVPGAGGPTGTAPGVASLGAAPPGPQDKQHGCTPFGKNPAASAVKIPAWTPAEQKPFVCHLCGQAFPAQDNLQAHYAAHRATGSSAHGERKPGMESTVVLFGTDGKRLPQMFPQETLVPSVNVTPVAGSQYTIMISGGLANNTNKISVIQSVGIPTPPVSQGATPAVDNAAVSKVDGSQPAAGADVEKRGADIVPKQQFPSLTGS